MTVLQESDCNGFGEEGGRGGGKGEGSLAGKSTASVSQYVSLWTQK